MESEIRPSELQGAAVKRVSASQEGCAPSQLGRLSQAVAIERLDALRGPPIEFRCSGYHVTVTADETIRTDP